MDFRQAVLSYWSLRQEAERQARERGNTDPGLRAGVTGGGHLDPLADLVREVLVAAEIPAEEIHSGRSSFELPGYLRAEEALGNATDLLHAAESGLLGLQPPWLGCVFLMQDEPASRQAVRVKEPHFAVEREFHGASYQRRAMLLCRRLLMKRPYDAAWFVLADPLASEVSEPAIDLSWAKFAAALRGRVGEILA